MSTPGNVAFFVGVGLQQRGRHCWKLRDQQCAFYGRIDTACILKHSLQHALDLLSPSCDQKGMKINSMQTELCLSLKSGHCTQDTAI